MRSAALSAEYSTCLQRPVTISEQHKYGSFYQSKQKIRRKENPSSRGCPRRPRRSCPRDACGSGGGTNSHRRRCSAAPAAAALLLLRSADAQQDALSAAALCRSSSAAPSSKQQRRAAARLCCPQHEPGAPLTTNSSPAQSLRTGAGRRG